MRRLANRLGRRGCSLLFFGMFDLVYAVSLFAPPESARDTPMLVWVASVAPLWVYAAAWASVGLLCLFYAWRREDSPAWAAAMLIKVGWAILLLAGWLVADLERGFVSVSVWLLLAVFVGVIASWPEPPQGWRERRWTPPSS